MRKLVAAVLLLALLGLSWSALWFYAAHTASTGVDAWLRSEQVRGRTWTCPDRTIGGYPFAVAVGCAGPTFAARAMGQDVRAEFASLRAEASLLHPRRVDLVLRPPLSYKTSDGQVDLRARWTDLSIGIDPMSQGYDLHGSGIAVDGDFGETGHQSGSAAGLDAVFKPAGPDTDPAVDFTIAVQSASLPAADDWLGGVAPFDIALAGSLTQAGIGDARTPEAMLETWREAGGRVELARSQITRGDTSAAGSGTLMLDDAHRPSGHLDARFVGLQPVLKRYGINGDLVATGALLSSLLGGRPQTGSANEVNLPISFQDGRLGIGPIRTAVELPPLY